jgi:UDP-N-acetylmuramate dehydrogenase
MAWTENISLQKYNTFGIDAIARYFAVFSTQDQLADLLQQAAGLPAGSVARLPGSAGRVAGSTRVSEPFRAPLFVLGGGSNILLTKNIDGPVMRNEIKGIELVDEDEHYVYVTAGAGESWNEFVQYCLKRNWAGVENLSLIPGSVGAAPMQNIGAYGVEIKDVFHELTAWDLREGKVYIFTLNDCRFGYRDSIFKGESRGRFVILSVTFRLNKIPVFHIAYGAIREELEKMGVQDLSIQAISQAVVHIRTSKLPDPAQIGNAGSFFKNPTIPSIHFEYLQKQFPGIVGYPEASPAGTGTGSASAPAKPPASAPATTKLAAGWLIEQCGWKGYRHGDAGVHARQALVLVNYGNATGHELYELSEEILKSVHERFGVTLEREVNII